MPEEKATVPLFELKDEKIARNSKAQSSVRLPMNVVPIDEKKSDEENSKESDREEIMDTIIEAVLSQISECSDRQGNNSISISSSNS